MKILLAEDDPSIGIVAKLSLEKIGGHVVTLVTDGAQAIVRGLEENFDLLLLDSMMPKKDGLTACQELLASGFETPIIFLSAKSSEMDIKEFLRAGAIGSIQKPFDPKNLHQKIDEILIRHKDHQERERRTA